MDAPSTGATRREFRRRREFGPSAPLPRHGV